EMQRVRYFPPDIKLELVRCRIANPNGQRSPITRKPRDLPLIQSTFAAQPVHDLKIMRATRHRPLQPVTPGYGFLVVTWAHQGDQCERCVPDPTITVVPVARTANLLGQRRRWRSNNSASLS